MLVVYGDRIRLVEVVQNLIGNEFTNSKPETQTRREIGAERHSHREALCGQIWVESERTKAPRFISPYRRTQQRSKHVRKIYPDR